jgi:AraC-like DNA-binding protein
MTIPDWADPQLSQDLPVLRSRGENQDLEYMESFPQNVRELGKEIAAFASSNQGTILIGVSNDGDIVGLEKARSIEGRDELLHRIEGICRGTIKPSITPTVKFAVEDDSPVLILLIPKGSQPIYYSNHVPYIRHITESRPAEPHEVIDLMKSWLATVELKEAEAEPLSQFFSDLARILVDVLIYADEAEDRSINPWLDLWRAQFQQASSDLRELSIQDIALEHNFSDEIILLSKKLDEIANFRMYFGCAPELKNLVSQVQEMAKKLKSEKIDSIPVSNESILQVSKLIVSSLRKLNDTESRIIEMIDQGRIEEVQSEVSDVGYDLLKLSYYNLDLLKVGINKELYEIGKELHLLETMRIYMDGGTSINIIISKISELSRKLYTVVKSLGDLFPNQKIFKLDNA